MTQISMSGVAVEFGDTVILSDVTFTVGAGEKWGVIGRNGTGKTTLFNLVTGAVQPTQGGVVRSPGLRMTLLEQHRDFGDAITVWQAVAGAFEHLLDLERSLSEQSTRIGELGEAATPAMLDRYAHDLERFEREGGYEVTARVDAVLHGPFTPGDSGFRFNRGVDDGRYSIASMKVEFHPDVNAAFVRPGIGALLQADAATGDLAWRRAELRLIARRMLGPLIYAARADAGVVVGDSIPPQQLFELGENQNLPGYGYKEFAGNQAAVIRGLVMYPFRIWRAPLRIGRYVFPSVAPTLSFGAQGGWASASSDAARSAIRRLGSTGDSVLSQPSGTIGAPVSRPTNGFKSSIDFRLRFLGGAVSAGVARATDHHQA